MKRTPFSVHGPHGGGRFRPQLELLEGRAAPGSLRGALEPPVYIPGLGLAASQRGPEITAIDGLHGSRMVKTTSDVLAFADLSVKGTSTLIRRADGVSINIKTTGLAPGAYTVWWAVFNNPEACTFGPGRCGEDPADFENPATGFAFDRATGGIVGEDGTATFAANLRVGEPLTEEGSFAPFTLTNAMTAEIQVVIRYHGPKDPGNIHDQTKTFQPELGLEADMQFTVHAAP
jgi:hypothetical protein